MTVVKMLQYLMIIKNDFTQLQAEKMQKQSNNECQKLLYEMQVHN